MSRPSQANPVAAARTLRALLELPMVAALAELPAEYDVLLVGGAVRDHLLGRPPRDFDAVVSHDGEWVADALAERLGAKAFRLGGDRFAAYRIDLPDGRLDLWDRHPMSLDDDLRRRDFTVNALAWRLRDRQLLDPYGGLEDLEGRRLRATSERSFLDDPLRVVRLARFTVQLAGFEPDDATVELARAAARDLDDVASERIREELRAALGAAGSPRALAMLERVGLFPRLWTGADSDGALIDAMDRLKRLDRRAGELERQLRPGAVERFVAVHAALFDQLREGGKRLRAFHARGLMSNRELRATEALLSWRRLPQTREDCRWFLHRSGDLWPAATVYLGSALSADDWRRASMTLVDLVRTRSEVIFAPPPLLNGHEISEILALPPGPRLGEIAGRLRRAQVEGRISTRSAAVQWLERLAGTDSGAGPR